jgi:ATP-dependent DNA ligase
VHAASRIKAQSFLIDGEAVVCRDDGLLTSRALRSRRRDHDVVLFAFDLIERATTCAMRRCWIATATRQAARQGPARDPLQ